MPTPKPVAGATLAPMSFPKVGGGSITIGGTRENWTLFTVYRGKHCPRCKKYLNILDGMRDLWREAGFDIAVVSADPEARPARTHQNSVGVSSWVTTCRRPRWRRWGFM